MLYRNAGWHARWQHIARSTQTYMILVQKECPECKNIFIPHAPNARVCSIRCKQKGERRRRAERNGAPMAEAKSDDKRFFRVLHSPTVVELTQLAKIQEIMTDAYVSITGTLPEWPDKPATTELLRQSDGSWIMRHLVDPDAEDRTMAGLYGMSLEEFKQKKYANVK